MGSLKKYYFSKTKDVIYTLVGSTLTGTGKYSAGIKASNGKIYFIPMRADRVLEFDPPTGVTTLIGSSYVFGADKWSGGVLASNGMIYCMPLNYNKVLKIDPSTGVTTLIGTDYISTTIIDTPGHAKWHGGALATNDRIYCIPRGHTQMLEIDPATDSTALVGSSFALYGEKYSYGVFVGGKIYGMPNTLNNVLVYDVTAGTTSTISTTLSAGSYKMGGCSLSQNGKIYTAPNTQTKVLVIDPVAGTTSTIESSVSGYISITLIQNGKIVCVPSSNVRLLEINPVTGITRLIGKNMITNSQYGACLGQNGKIYTSPYDATRVVQIEILRQIDVVGTDINVPSPLSGLSASNYNKYYNNR